MKTKILNGVAAALITFSIAATAESDRQHMGGMMTQSGGSEMPMMDTGAMREQFNQMLRTMDRIHKSNNPQEQQKLMQQHMDEMYRGMGMMGGMMSGNMPGGMSGGMSGGMPGDMSAQMGSGQMQGQMGNREKTMGGNDEADLRMMRDRYNQMEQRMDMMQNMMRQMMEHMVQQEKMGMGRR